MSEHIVAIGYGCIRLIISLEPLGVEKNLYVSNNSSVKPKYLSRSSFIAAWFVGIFIGVVAGSIFGLAVFDSIPCVMISLVIFLILLARPQRKLFVVGVFSGILFGLWRNAGAINGKIVEPSQWDFVVDVRDWFLTRLRRAIPEPEAGLGIAYLLGVKDYLSKTLSEDIKAVGLAHIVVASGTHLSILVDIVKKIFSRISRFAILFFSEFFVVFFMMMIGWTPSILRAGIMCSLNLFLWYIGRRIAPWRIILQTAVITLIINPTFLVNLGWLLSFASFSGIMLICPLITKFFYGRDKPNFLVNMILATVSSTFLTLPITLYFFGSFSLISVVANLLILPTLPCVMGLTFCAGVFNKLPLVGNILAFLADKLLNYHTMIVEFFSSLKYFIITIPKGNPWVFLLYIPILVPIGFLWFRYRRPSVDSSKKLC